MATVSESIDTLISNVQNAASEMTSEMLGAIDWIYNYLPSPGEFGAMPTVSTLPANSFTEPTELLQMLTDAKNSLSEIGAAVPPLSDLAPTTTSAAP